MPSTLSLRELIAALQFGDPTEDSFLERQTGRIVPRRELLEEAGPSSPTDHAAPIPGYERLPAVTDREELAFARQFLETLKNPDDRPRLELALASGNPREAFEMTVFRCQIANEWYQYRDRGLEQFAKDWLDARGLAYTDDVSQAAE